jgi:hypothetical protein
MHPGGPLLTGSFGAKLKAAVEAPGIGARNRDSDRT